MKGSVKVRFRITSAGKLSGLTASGPRIFINSAKKAVKKAFPLSARGVSLPMNVALTLNYRLKK
jgi:outer membrane biosynthesis protein TonB